MSSLDSLVVCITILLNKRCYNQHIRVVRFDKYDKKLIPFSIHCLKYQRVRLSSKFKKSSFNIDIFTRKVCK